MQSKKKIIAVVLGVTCLVTSLGGSVFAADYTVKDAKTPILASKPISIEAKLPSMKELAEKVGMTQEELENKIKTLNMEGLAELAKKMGITLEEFIAAFSRTTNQGAARTPGMTIKVLDNSAVQDDTKGEKSLKGGGEPFNVKNQAGIKLNVLNGQADSSKVSDKSKDGAYTVSSTLPSMKELAEKAGMTQEELEREIKTLDMEGLAELAKKMGITLEDFIVAFSRITNQGAARTPSMK